MWFEIVVVLLLLFIAAMSLFTLRTAEQQDQERWFYGQMLRGLQLHHEDLRERQALTRPPQ